MSEDKGAQNALNSKLVAALIGLGVGGGAATGGWAIGGQPVDMTPITSRIEQVERTLSSHGIELARMEEQGKAMRKLLEQEIPKLRQTMMSLTNSVNALELKLSLLWDRAASPGGP
jgi:hypothetical protein